MEKHGLVPWIFPVMEWLDCIEGHHDNEDRGAMCSSLQGETSPSFSHNWGCFRLLNPGGGEIGPQPSRTGDASHPPTVLHGKPHRLWNGHQHSHYWINGCQSICLAEASWTTNSKPWPMKYILAISEARRKGKKNGKDDYCHIRIFYFTTTFMTRTWYRQLISTKNELRPGFGNLRQALRMRQYVQRIACL